ncbi:MAG: MATE family efflux transporter [Anaerolineae bacterium]|nr:MATE family efflux transporter [Anaerolineae bacterium]
MREFFDDKDFFRALARLWFPIALQQLIFSLLGFATVTMVGQLGETAVAAVGLANQILFLFQLLLFGVGSGSAIFIAQFWGKRDVKNIRRVLGICLGLSLLGAGLFSFIALVIPEFALALYSNDRAVIEQGGAYLRIAGWSYIPLSITTSYAVALRSTGNVRLPVSISVTMLTLGAGLSYALIFGAFGLPALGVLGSAISITLARALECGTLLTLVYARGEVVAASPREMWTFDKPFLAHVLKSVIPVTLNEIVWSLGISTYSAIYGRIGTEALAAVNIAAAIETVAYVPFVGLAGGGAVLIGNAIGADKESEALRYAKRLLQIALTFSVSIGIAILLSADALLGLYNVDAITRGYARQVLIVMACGLWLKASNSMYIIGILRAGGDVRVSALIDVIPLWFIGIPSTAIAAFVLGLPVPWVYLLTFTDEVAKAILATRRVFAQQWIKNLARQAARAAQT